jgi:hypothetical protein
MTQFNFRRPIAALAGAVVALGLFGAVPARALDDGQENIFDSLLDLAKMGLGFPTGEGEATIDYHERAPLVLPPKMELEKPLPPVEARNKAWPVDQTLARQRAAAAAAARPRNHDDEADDLSARDLKKGRIARSQQAQPEPARDCDETGGRLCDPTKFWNTLKSTRKDDDSTRGLVAGVEPPRATLTDPPRGYRVPTKSVAATFEPRDDSYSENLGSGPAQVREEARRRREANY